MSGFLENLLLRETGQAETLAPRLPSLYETDSRSAALAGDGFAESEVEPVETEHPTPLAAGMPAHRALAAPPLAPGIPVQPPPAMPPAAAPLVPAPPALPTLAAPPRLAPRDSLPPLAADAPMNVAPSPVAAPAAAEPRPREPVPVLRPRSVAGRAELERVGEFRPTPAARPAPERTIDARPAPEDKPLSVRGPVPVEAALAVAGQPAREQPQRENALAPRRAQAPEQQAASPSMQAPDIHITIGRVEVRALPASARPARAGNAAQAVTLEQYLSRRNGQGAR